MSIATMSPAGGGASDTQKRHAAGRDDRRDRPWERMLTAGRNCERVALLHGTGHWTRKAGRPARVAQAVAS